MGQSARGSTSQWRRLVRDQRARLLPCHLCGQPIDYSLSHPDPGSFSADHRLPWAKYPELRYDPGNIVSTHLRCNMQKGDSLHFTVGLGLLSEEF